MSVKKLFTLTIFLLIFSFDSHSQLIDSSFYNWTIYEIFDQKNQEKKCYMINRPESSESDHNSRGEPYISITRYQNRRFEEISVYSGFEYKRNGKILIAIDNRKFLLTTNRDLAWAKTKVEDAIIIQKMLVSAYLKIRSDSAIGTFAIDSYNLKGIAKAYRRLKKICE